MKKKLVTLGLTFLLAMGLSTVVGAADVTEFDSEDGLVAALTAGGNITLTDTIETSEIADTIVIGANTTTYVDLGGHTLTLNLATDKSVQVTGENAELTFYNGDLKINRKDATATNLTIYVAEKATLTMDTVNFTPNGAGVYIAETSSAVNIIDSSVTSEIYAVATNASSDENHNVAITISDSTIETTGVSGVPLFLNVQGTLDVTDTIVTSKTTAIFVREGTASFEGVTVNIKDFDDVYSASVDLFDYFDKTWGSGTSIPSAAIVVGNRSTSDSYDYPAIATFKDVTINTSEANYDTGEDAYSKQLYLYGSYADGSESSATVTIQGTNDFGTITQGGGATNVILDTDYTIESSDTYTIPADSALTIKEGATLTVEGSLDNYGTITNDGTITFASGAGIDNDGSATITNDGTIVVNDGGTILTTAALSTTSDGTVELGSDISTVTSAIGDSEVPFVGTFDGKGCTVTLSIGETDDYQGLFGYINGATIQNVIVDGSVSGAYYVGGIVGSATGEFTINNCENKAAITGTFRVGGIVGDASSTGGTISECSNSGTIYGDSDEVGGIAGVSNSNITDCTNSGNISGADDSYYGGIVGRMPAGNISNCDNTGNVTGDAFVGGIVGYIFGDISNCTNSGEITITDGVVTTLTCAYAGGIAGSTAGDISNCDNSGAVIGKYAYVGGIAGYADEISNSSNTGAVSGADYVGGIVGYAYENIIDCYSTVEPTGDSNVGGIYGYDASSGALTTFTIDFDANGGTMTYNTLYMQTGEDFTLSSLETPTKSDYIFDGWVDEDGNDVDASTVFTADTTLTASWSVEEEESTSSGGNYTPSTTTTTTTTTTTDSSSSSVDTSTNDDDSVTATVETSTSTSSGVTSTSVDEDTISDAVSAAEEAADGEDIYVEITVDTKSSTTSVEVELSAEALEVLVDSGVEALVITSDVAVVTIPEDALEEVLDASNGYEITVVVSDASSDLNSDQEAIVGDAPVYDISILCDGDKITAFGGESIVITLPYELKDGESAENIVVWYVDDDGVITPMYTVYDEETETVTFVTTHLSVYAVVNDTNVFEDVDPNDYYYDAVLWAVENGVTGGTSDTTFSPASTCTRAQAVTFLWRAAGEPASTIANPFTDLEEGAYYYDAVLWAVEMGITAGTTETTFDPYASCTRGQIVTFLWRMAGEPSVYGEGMSDVADGAYYYSAVNWAIDQGITTGYADGTFGPATLCNRGAIVTFLYRYLG